MIFCLWALVGCETEAAEDVRQLLGTISAYESELEVWDGSTYFYADEDTMVMYMNQVEDLSCAETAAVLARNSTDDAEFNPDTAMAPGYCTLTVSTGAWSGSIDLSIAQGESTSEAIIGLYCPLEGGEWSGEEGTYAYAGPVWNGVPDGFELQIDGDDGGGTWEISMDAYTGSDPNEFGSDYPGTGSVAGSGNVEWCEDFADTPVFP